MGFARNCNGSDWIYFIFGVLLDFWWCYISEHVGAMTKDFEPESAYLDRETIGPDNEADNKDWSNKPEEFGCCISEWAAESLKVA